MDNEVGVDPERIAQAASALENLRDVLTANVPVIVNTLSEYTSSGAGSPVNLAPLKQAEARCVPDAADMRARANLAAAFMASPVSIDLVLGGVAYIPWSGPALDAEDSQLDAQDLASAVALAKTDPVAARAAVAAIARDISDHAGDPAFLKDFWSQPGASAAAASLASVLRTTQDGKKIHAPSASDHDNVVAILASAAIPIGFSGTKAYMQFAQRVNDGLTDAGYPNATVAVRGSSVTGIRFRTGEPVSDDNPPGDYDLAIADPDLFERAQQLGIQLRGGGTRTAPLNEAQLDELGLSDLAEEMSTGPGPTVSFMIYKDQGAIDARGDNIVAPDGDAVTKYYNQQLKTAQTDQVTEEVQAEQAQALEQEQAEIAEEEAEAEAFAEAEALAMDDE
jgi:hypothetical protein